MIKRIAIEAWRYWKWLCVVFTTTFIVLVIATFVVQSFQRSEPQNDPAYDCIQNGGSWNADTSSCEGAA